MGQSRSKTGYFVIEGLNSLATTYYFYYIYFFAQEQFGFGKLQNFLVAASWGVFYTAFSIWGGKIGQRHGYHRALKAGFLILAVSLACGAFLFSSLALQGVVYVVAIFGMALTWPALEALVSEGEPAERLQRNIGIYNLVWAGLGAVAYFSGGAMIKALSFKAMFLVPAAVHVCQYVIVAWMERGGHTGVNAAPRPETHAAADDAEEQQRSPVPPHVFLKMAWLGNPFGYLAVNTVIAVVPALSKRLELSVVWAGVFCSLWLFVRTASFALLWKWNGWHYRFRWLVAAYVMMGLSFVAILTIPNLAVLVVAQVLFGLSLGLLYYSSLYYSMHVGETKGEHGGFHEAMIGVGSFAGPAVSAMSLHFMPQHTGSSAVAVGALLLGGLGALLALRFRKADR